MSRKEIFWYLFSLWTEKYKFEINFFVSDWTQTSLISSSNSLHTNWTETESESPEQFWFVSTVSSGSVQINPHFTVTCEDILSLHADDVQS